MDYITIERNSRGNLEISMDVLNKMIENAISTSFAETIDTLKVESELSHDQNLYLTLNILLTAPEKLLKLNEKKIVKEVESILQRTLELKEKNISLVYRK
jgi:hypothetical protein